MSDIHTTKILATFTPKGKWHLAVIDSERSGATFLPIVCFATVETRVDNGVHAARIEHHEMVPYIVDLEEQGSSSLTLGTAFGDRVIGIVPPGMRHESYWNETAEEMVKQEREIDDKKVRRKLALKISKSPLTEEQKRVLHWVVKAHKLPEDWKAADVLELATLGLIEPHIFSSGERATWIPTQLARDVDDALLFKFTDAELAKDEDGDEEDD